MKLRVRSEGRTEKVDFEGDPTVAEVKESVAQAFGQDVGSFELSLNGQEALVSEPDSPLSHCGIVSGDLLRIIRTSEGAIGSRSTVDQAPASQCLGTGQTGSEPACVGSMEIDDGTQNQTSKGACRTPNNKSQLGTPAAPDLNSTRTMSATTDESQGPSGCQARMEDGNEDAPRSVREPMLCRSATDCLIPQRLRALYSGNRPRTLEEALCIVLHVLMVETGFQTEPVADSSESNSQVEDSRPGTSTFCKKQPTAPSVDDARASMPASWRVSGVHRLRYCHPSLEGAVCSIACVPVGKQTVVYGVTAGKTSFTLQLNPSEYVTSLGEQPVYTNLPQLSRLFKDSIAYSLLLTTRSELGLVPLNGLLALFPEIQLLILSFLDLRSLLNVSEVCNHFYNMATDRSLWRQLLLRDFGCKESEQCLDWRELYKQEYKNKKDLERYRRNLMDRSVPVRPGMFLPPPPLPPNMPGYPPGYRGGDYDLDPFASLAPPHLLPIRRDPTIIPFPGPDIVPFPSRDPILNPLPRVPNRRDPLGSGQGGRGGRSSGSGNRGFYF
ncbi:F-box only protein 7-like [Patiria miniata]|uniref:F-box protein 7 n=1 Tax=Patiria miniata TaxID=46514 RepID=A0A914AUB2_PATMI|nr:F-box only protein 7-like [Patiria miniata]